MPYEIVKPIVKHIGERKNMSSAHAIGIAEDELINDVKELTGRLIRGKRTGLAEKFFTRHVTAYLEALEVSNERLGKTSNHQAIVNSFRSQTEKIILAGEESLAHEG